MLIDYHKAGDIIGTVVSMKPCLIAKLKLVFSKLYLYKLNLII